MSSLSYQRFEQLGPETQFSGLDLPVLAYLKYTFYLFQIEFSR